MISTDITANINKDNRFRFKLFLRTRINLIIYSRLTNNNIQKLKNDFNSLKNTIMQF